MLRQPRWRLVTVTSSQITIGIDEVGRGPWAGPLVVGAVALDMGQSYDGLADSKQLTRKFRQTEAVYIKRQALGVGLGWVDPSQLDRLGMTASLKLAASLAYGQLPPAVRSQADQIVIDGNVRLLDDPRVLVLVKADAKVQAVSAASIVAKVARDSYMAQIARLFPNYGFERHVGYGTAAHRQALDKCGVLSGIHRASFAPIRHRLAVDSDIAVDKLAATDGRKAEAAAADFLLGRGYTVIERNWRTSQCEIDIIARRDGRLYFVEVKYRENDQHGDGLDAITPRKLQQMKFAARVYLHTHQPQTNGDDPQLMAIAMCGRPPMVEQVVKITD